MSAGDEPTDRLLPALTAGAQAGTSSAAKTETLKRRIAQLEHQLTREHARNEGLKIGIEQLSGELQRLRDQDPG